MDAGELDPKFREVCSTQTVQSQNEGFFQELFESVLDACSSKWLNKKFLDQHSDQEKLRALLADADGGGDLLIGMLEHVAPVFKPKNAAFSAQQRREGERVYEAKGDYRKALLLLTQAVLRAPEKGADLSSDGGITLAFALWTRAAILLELGNGRGALSDLQHSLTCGLPAKTHGAYYVRLARANALIGEKAKAEVCIKLAERLCQDSETQRGIADIRGQLDTLKVPVEPTVSKPTVSFGPNAKLPSASSLLEMVTLDKNAGNYMVARDNVKTGDILLVEQPTASCLVHTKFATHCLHCMSRLTVPYGCPDCAGVAFCSLACRDKACSTYHRYECQFMDLLIGSGMSVLCFLALRFVAQCSSPDVAVREGRRIVADLCGHSAQRTADDFLRRSVMAVFLLSILQKSGFFGQRKTESVQPTKVELEVCEVLLGLLQVLQFNAHEIYETKLAENHRFKGSKQLNIGVALYTTGALFNHDCDPGVSRYFVGTTIVLTACRPMMVGETIAENYGPNFTRTQLAQRRRSLSSRYWFRCECRPCREDWKTLDKLTNKARLKCPTLNCEGIFNYPMEPRKSVKCVKCHKMVSLQAGATQLLNCEEHYRRAAECMDKNDTENAIREFVEGIELFYSVGVPPHKDTHIAQASLRMCMADQGSVVPFNQLLC